ncbi:hypothetical protein ACO0LD_19600 [Undibacterium sp. Ji83W]|uniref:hypothetical protein n=1 Tax=Undibacterium sp. Ji83W TaxID=3413043 RepID=UPI003BF29FAD
MELLLLLVCVLALLYGARLLQIALWPKVQVRVLSTSQEITGDDDGCATGWLHVELKYWHQSQKYQVQWRVDLMQHRHLPDALWMVIAPSMPEHPRFPISIIKPLAVLTVSVICLAIQLTRLY